MPDDTATVDLATQERMAQIYHLRESLQNYREKIRICISLADSSVSCLLNRFCIVQVTIQFEVWLDPYIYLQAASTLLNSLKNAVIEFPKKWPMYNKISTRFMTKVGSFNMPGGFYTRTEVLNHMRTDPLADNPTFYPALLKLLHIMASYYIISVNIIHNVKGKIHACS